MDLIDRIDNWGRARPDRPAHLNARGAMTYAELVERSNAVASAFRRDLPSESTPIAVLGHKEHEMLVGFLGSVKAGHPYIPLDSSLPAPRIASIVEGSGAVLYPVERIRELQGIEQPPSTPSRLQPDDLWYVIFTSGSTGDPKGVMITRGCLESFVDWTLEEQRFRPAQEVFLNQAPFSFDLSVMDLYSSLATGGTLFSITQDEMAAPRQLFETLGKSHISIWVSTPSFARMCLMQPTFNEAMLPDVRKFWFCGETLAPEVAAELARRFSRAEVWNTYGPTEATVATTSLQITPDVIGRFNPLPVGRVKPGSRITIRDDEDRILPAGARGEIVIAGPNVARGYLGRPDLTERVFLEVEGHRAYRTGDAGHFESDLLFFEGRMDFQIKLHGYRIELGDIESNLHKLGAVRDAVVLPVMRDGRPEYLVAFAILKKQLDATDFETSQSLRQQLAEHLPDYMVPRKFVFLREFPTTPNGKVDRQKLAKSVQ